jgi:MinD superfamily P-loop ATPase
MIEVVKDSDYCVLVTESTPYGLNDLVLAVNVLKTFNIPFGVIINKYDESFQDDMEYLIANDVDVLMTIPFNRGIAEAYSEGRILIEYDNFAKSKFKELFKKIGSIVKLNGVEIA